MIILVSSSTSLGHSIKKSKLSRVKLLMCFKRGFNSVSVNSVSFLVGHLGSSIIGFSFRSFISKISMSLPLAD